MFQRIFVPLDGSPRAESAVPVAAQIARATGGSLLLVQVIRLPIDYSGGLAPVPFMTDQMVETETTMVNDYLKMVASSTALSDISVKTDVMFGFPAQSLIATIKAQESDLVVMCSRGRTGLTRWALGSVAHTLVHQSTAPVLVLRQSDADSAFKTGHALSALVPLDGSELAEAALRPAAHLVAALAAPAQGRLHLAQVVKPVSSSLEEGADHEFTEAAPQQASAYLEQVSERLQATMGDLKLAITQSVECERDVATALLRMAEHEGQSKGSDGDDLIVMSTHGRSGLERWMMGSITERILNTTKLPLLVVRPPKYK
jgi:nucleotide-binding universal stress UspA family protein